MLLQFLFCSVKSETENLLLKNCIWTIKVHIGNCLLESVDSWTLFCFTVPWLFYGLSLWCCSNMWNYKTKPMQPPFHCAWVWNVQNSLLDTIKQFFSAVHLNIFLSVFLHSCLFSSKVLINYKMCTIDFSAPANRNCNLLKVLGWFPWVLDHSYYSSVYPRHLDNSSHFFLSFFSFPSSL